MNALTTPSIIDNEVSIHLVGKEGLNVKSVVFLNKSTSGTGEFRAAWEPSRVSEISSSGTVSTLMDLIQTAGLFYALISLKSDVFASCRTR